MDQEPYRVGPRTLSSSLLGINMRYSLLRYFYSTMFLNSYQGAHLFFKPMFIDFHWDRETFNHIDRQIMVGDSLLFSPALEEATDDYDAYFPNANWNEFPSGKKFLDHDKASLKGKLVKLSGQYSIINLHMVGGKILLYQDSVTHGVLRTKKLNDIPSIIYVNPNVEGKAEGSVAFDDGVSSDTLKTNSFLLVKMNLVHHVITFKQYGGEAYKYTNNDAFIEQFVILRSKLDVSKIKIVGSNERIYNFEATYDEANDKTVIKLVDKADINDLSYVILG